MADQPIRALIIEDNADEAGIIASYLADGPEPSRAFALTQVPRISTATHLLARAAFDVILIDLVLPSCVGLEGFKKIRAMRPALPIIVLTGLQDESLAAQAVGLGAQDYLIKGSPDCCLLKRAIRYAIETKRLSNLLEERLGAAQAAAPGARIAGPERLKGRKEEITQELRRLEFTSRLLNRISHELRNTLAVMKTAVYYLKDGAADSLTAAQSRMIDLISRNVDRQTRIIDDLLNLAHPRPDRPNIQFRLMDIGALISQVAQEFRLLGSTHNIQVDINGALPLVNGDSDLIVQVLRRLIGNGLRFAKKTVIIKAAPAGQEGVSISVIDDGPGIAPELLDELFTGLAQENMLPDECGHKARRVGLNTCKEIVASHRGRIWAESAPGRGARLCFLLPVSGNPGAAVGTNGRAVLAND